MAAISVRDRPFVAKKICFIAFLLSVSVSHGERIIFGMYDTLEVVRDFKNYLIERLERINHPFADVGDMSTTRVVLSGVFKCLCAADDFEEFLCN